MDAVIGAMAKYRCKICGEIYDEEKEGVKFQDLPDDWKCPRCKASKSNFELVEEVQAAGELDYDPMLVRTDGGIMDEIHAISVSGSSVGEPMDTLLDVPKFDDILILGAQLATPPRDDGEEVNIRTVIGKNAKKPMVLESPVYVSHMSFGALSKSAKVALAKGTAMAKTAMCSGEGGVLPVPEEYVKQVRAVCDEKDVLLIIDEVQTGIGRTGKLFAFENYAVKPDVITLAKGLGGGLPIGACLCKKELSGVMGAGTHGSTFGGNPVVCSGALKVLETIDEEFLGAVVEKGEYIRSKLKEMPEVAEIRGMGLMLGISLKTRSAKEIAAKALENGLTILTAKDSLRMLPPLNITYAEIDEGLERLAKTLE